jgi:hypothetical protein
LALPEKLWLTAVGSISQTMLCIYELLTDRPGLKCGRLANLLSSFCENELRASLVVSPARKAAHKLGASYDLRAGLIIAAVYSTILIKSIKLKLFS